MRPLRLTWPQRLLFAATMGALAGWASQARVFWQQDENIHDRLVGNWNYPPDPRLAIVAIDERSLQQLGQWPWPRSTHARLIEQLDGAGASRIALDLMLLEPDHRGDGQDAELAAAMRRSGKVVLPVLAATASEEAVPEELLPLPVFADAAAALAHTDVEIDGDGVVRGLYLKAGVGTAYWPALGLALAGTRPVPGIVDPEAGTPSPYKWRRDHYVRLRYAGPPGSFPQLSYIDVLEGRTPPGLLQDRLVIVGMTASGLAPRLLTPTSRESWMSGSEYQANVASMLLGGHAVLPLPAAAQSGIVALLVALAALAISLARPLPWLGAAIALPAPVLLAFVLLHGFNLWFAPAAAVAGVIAILLVRALWQLRHWRRQANRDPLTGLANRLRFEQALQREHDAARRSGKPLSLALIDVDHFKRCNDSHGHHIGDLMLRQVAQNLDDLAHYPRDLAARFGGDEFALILPDTPSDAAVQRIESLIMRMRRQGITVERNQQVRITLSIGLCTRVPAPGDLPSHLFQAADDALYQAKENGRNGYQLAPRQAG